MQSCMKWTRKAQQVNKSLWICLPAVWCSSLKVSKGDILELALSKEGRLYVEKMSKKGDGE